MSQATMQFVQPSESQADVQPQAKKAKAPIKDRARNAGQRHGKAFGNAGGAVTAYGAGFMSGFMSAFADNEES
jgi:hypothetical protein